MDSINRFRRFVKGLKLDRPVENEIEMYIKWIEDEHAKSIQQEIDEAYAKYEVVNNKYFDMRDFCQRLAEAAKKHEDVTLFDVDYTVLPIDVDREAWHVGDFVVGELNSNNPQKVKRMLWYGPDLGWRLETDDIIFSYPERLCHYWSEND